MSIFTRPIYRDYYPILVYIQTWIQTKPWCGFKLNFSSISLCILKYIVHRIKLSDGFSTTLKSSINDYSAL